MEISTPEHFQTCQLSLFQSETQVISASKSRPQSDNEWENLRLAGLNIFPNPEQKLVICSVLQFERSHSTPRYINIYNWAFASATHFCSIPHIVLRLHHLQNMYHNTADSQQSFHENSRVSLVRPHPDSRLICLSAVSHIVVWGLWW